MKKKYILLFFGITLFFIGAAKSHALGVEDNKRCLEDTDFAMINYSECCAIQGSLTGPCKRSNQCLMLGIYNCDMLEFRAYSWYINWRNNVVTNSTNENIDLMIITDASGSVYSRVSEPAQIVTKGLADSLKPDDRFGIIHYASYVTFSLIKGIDSDNHLNDSYFFYDEERTKEETKERNGITKIIHADERNWIKVLDFVANKLNQVNNGNKKVVIWLTDGFDGENKVDVLVNNNITFYVAKLYNSSLNDPSYWGYQTEKTNGKYYILNEQSVEEIADCNSKTFADNHVGECCNEYPETCKSKEVEKEIIKNCNDKEYYEKNKNICSKIECIGFHETATGKFLQKLLDYIKYLVTVLVILLSVMDFAKAMSASEDDKMKEAQKNFIKRLIIVVILYFLVPVINLIFQLVGIGGTCGLQ